MTLIKFYTSLFSGWLVLFKADEDLVMRRYQKMEVMLHFQIIGKDIHNEPSDRPRNSFLHLIICLRVWTESRSDLSFSLFYPDMIKAWLYYRYKSKPLPVWDKKVRKLVVR